jgi:hypothetical protein
MGSVKTGEGTKAAHSAEQEDGFITSGAAPLKESLPLHQPPTYEKKL